MTSLESGDKDLLSWGRGVENRIKGEYLQLVLGVESKDHLGRGLLAC